APIDQGGGKRREVIRPAKWVLCCARSRPSVCGRPIVTANRRFAAMSRYRVSFFKNLLSSDGHQFRCLQQSVVIRRARSPDRAIEAAKRRFERCCHLADWRLHADGVELEI